MNALEVLDLAENSHQLKEQIAEAFISDIMGQLNVIDPSDDGDEIWQYLIETLHSTDETTGNVLAFLLGTDTLDEWLEEFGED